MFTALFATFHIDGHFVILMVILLCQRNFMFLREVPETEPDIGGQRVEGDQQNPALLGDKARMADGPAIFKKNYLAMSKY